MTDFRERLSPGTGTVVAVLLLAPLLFLTVLPISAPLAFVAGIGGTALVEALIFLTAPIVAVSGGELRAGRAHIPVALTGATSAHRGRGATAARGTELDARAWTLIRGWIDPVIRVEITDPEDPAPYWVVSTRRPEELEAALVAARATAPVAD